MLSIDDTGPPPPCPAPFNLASYVLAHAQDTPDKIALAVLGPSRAERWSFGRLNAAVLGVAGALQARGFTPGTRVLLRLGSTVEFPVAFLACAAADLVPVPVSAQLTAPELRGLIAEVTPKLIIADPALPWPETDLPLITLDDLADLHDHAPGTPVQGDPDRAGYIVFTSGTSGVARGVVHAHRAIHARAMMRDGWTGLGPTDRVLHAGAFNWTYTLGTGLLDPWAAGATALVPAAGVTPAQLPLLLQRHQATIFAAVPGVYRQILKSSITLKLPALRHGLSAGEKLPDSLRTRWADATGTPIFEAFGMSECSTFVSGSPARTAPAGTLGFAQPGRCIAVLDDSGVPVPRGTEGTLAVHRADPGLMLGYLGHADETEDRMRGDWFLTGDSVTMRDDGAVEYHGRSDDIMTAGGYRVSPVEVEAALATHPDVADVAVTEVAVSPETTLIAAFIVSGRELDDAALSGHMSDHLARYKHPRLFVRVDTLPKSANGKLMRRHLRERYEARHGQA